MTNLRKWSTTASGNATIAGGVSTVNLAEGQAPSTVNNSLREAFAQIRKTYTPDEWGWVDCSATASVASQTTFKLTGNQTADYTANRRTRLKSGSTTRYGTIVSSSFTSETTVTITVDSGSLSASHTLAAVAAIDSNHVPANSYITSASAAAVFLTSASAALSTYLTSASASSALALKQGVIAFADEGTTLSTAGSVATVSFVGSGLSASLTSGLLTVTSSGGSTLGTEAATTSGATVDITGLPAGTKKIFIMYNNVSTGTNGSAFGLRLGDSGGFEATGYVSTNQTGTTITTSTTGFLISQAPTATSLFSGHVLLTRVNSSHLWILSSILAADATDGVSVSAGSKTLSAELTQLRLYQTGAGSYDAGSVNIIYE